MLDPYILREEEDESMYHNEGRGPKQVHLTATLATLHLLLRYPGCGGGGATSSGLEGRVSEM